MHFARPHRSVLSILLLLLLPFSAVLGQKPLKPKQLPQQYRDWLEQDVPYIITQSEREHFLLLQTDITRDKFIEQFWETRNPIPRSPINTFKEEHYSRLAYVRTHFGDERYNDGWRSDQGRVYITLGPPQQIAKFHQGIMTRPVEIWFYQSPSPALPSYFNVVFYERGAGEPYRLYSPTQDGPTRIVTNDTHDDAQALHTIEQSMGSEAERDMISLLPDEPVNLIRPEFSQSSDTLINQILSLPEQPLEQQRIARLRADNREQVNSSVFTGANSVVLDTALLHDAAGGDTVHFLLREQNLEPQIVGKLPDSRTGWNMTLLTRVTTEQGKAIYQQHDTLLGVTSADGAKTAATKLFAAEGRLPLVPGTYYVEATLTNELNHLAARTTRKLTVPAERPDSIGISDLIAYTAPSPIQDPEGQLPFSTSQLRFTPRGAQTAQIHFGDKLPIVYQIWFPQSDLKVSGDEGKLVHVHYVIGNLSAAPGDEPLHEDEDIQIQNLDHAGNLLTGRTLDTTHLSIGNYKLIAKVTEPGTSRAAFATMTLRVMPSDARIDTWTAYGEERQHPVWQDDILRGITAEAVGDPTHAAVFYKRALAVNADATEAQTRLTALNRKLAAQNTAPEAKPKP